MGLFKPPDAAKIQVKIDQIQREKHQQQKRDAVEEYNKYSDKVNLNLKRLLRYKKRHPDEGKTFEVNGQKIIGWSIGQSVVTIDHTPVKFYRHTSQESYAAIYLLWDGRVLQLPHAELPAKILNLGKITRYEEWSQQSLITLSRINGYIYDNYFIRFNIFRNTER